LILDALAASFADELTKIAKVVTPLQPHQQRVVNRIQEKDQPGLVVAHGLGSGKTLTSIAAQEALGHKASVVVPASLKANYRKEVKKHVRGKTPTRHLVSMQNMATKKTPPTDPMMIVDEAHRARDTSTSTYQTLKNNEAEKRLLLTGSPFYNHPSDIAPLVNIAAGKNVLPGTKEDFSSRYISNNKVSPGILRRLMGVRPGSVEGLNQGRAKELKGHLAKWVDYHPNSTTDFPEVQREDVRVPMTPQQLKYYDTVMGQAPAWVSYKVRSGLPPSKTEAKQLNSFLTGARQISNTTGPYHTEGQAQDPKIQMAYDNLKQHLDANPNAKAVVYSNFLDAGINPYKAKLEEGGIPYGEFTGEMPKAKRDDLVKQYNANKIRALLLSSAGGEGLDLRGTRLMQILDPHWNNEKLKQVEGRGIRYQSHSDLPPEERKILVQKYLSTRVPKGLLEKIKLKKPGGSVDEYLSNLASQKEKLIDEFRGLLPQEPQPQPAG
jgi:superfamily II DNA or RNA helicase